MAKSFHDILKTGKIDVLHNGDEITLELPEWLAEAAEHLMNEDALLQWAKDNEVLHGLLHSGIKQEIIMLRAAARPKDIADPSGLKGDMVKVSIVEDADGAQTRVDNYVCKPTPAPGAVSNKKVSAAIELERKKMAVAMKAAGIEDDVIAATIAQLS